MQKTVQGGGILPVGEEFSEESPMAKGGLVGG